MSESIGLITAANSVIQDPEAVGTALKTISMRLRSSSSDLEKAGEDTEGAVESVSKLRAELLALSGVDIMLDDNTYRSTYDIIVDLSKVWSQLTDIQQASITALVSGVRQGNVFSSTLSNMQSGIAATETALNSSGSAMKENEKQISSIKGRISQFTAAFEELSAKTLNSDWLKTIIQMGTGVLNLVNNLGGLLPILVAIGGAITAIKLPAIILSITKFAGIIQALPAALSMASAALGAKATATKTLDMALGALNVTATSTQLIIGGITAVLAIGLMAWGAYISAQEKNIQKAKEAQQAIISESESVEDLIKQYKDLTKAGDWDNETRDIAKDIQEKLTELVGDEAKNLDLVNGKLDEQITKLKAIEVQTLKNKENALIAATNVAEQEYKNKQGSSSYFGISYQYSKQFGFLSSEDKRAFNYLKDAMEELEVSSNGISSHIMLVNESALDTSEKIAILKKALDQLKSAGLSNTDVFTQLQTSLQGYKETINNVDKANKDLNENSAKILIATKLQTEEIPKTTEEYKAFKEELVASATAVDDVTGEYKNAFRGSAEEIENAIDSILLADNNFNEFTDIIVGGSRSIQTAVIALKKDIDSLLDSDQVKTLGQAWQELEEYGTVSSKTMLELIDLYPELISYRDEDTNAITLTKDVILEKYEIEKQVHANTIKSLKEELQARKDVIDEIKKHMTTMAVGSWQSKLLQGLLDSPEYDTSDLEAKIKALEGLYADISIGSLFGDKSKSSKKEEDPWLDAANAKIAEAKYLFDMGEKTQKEYLDEIQKINQQYFKGRKKYLDESRQLDVEYYQGMQQLREEYINSYLESADELKNKTQDLAKYINDLSWALNNWANMSPETRDRINGMIFDAQIESSENIISDLKSQIDLLDDKTKSEEELISLYNKIKSETLKEIESYRKAGHTDDSREIKDLKNSLTELDASIYDENENIHRRKTSNIQNEIEILEEQGGKEEELVQKYKDLQVEAYEQVKRLKDQGLTEEDKLVKEYLDIWRDAYKSMKEMQADLTEDRINDIEHQIFLLGKATEYSGEKNISGKPNAQIIAQYESLMQIAQEEMDKLFAQGFTENDTSVQEWQKKWYSYYDAIVKAGEDAFNAMQSAEKESLEKMSEDIKSKHDDLNTIVEKTIDLIKHEQEEIIDGLEAQKDGYKDIIDKRKELLQTYRDEANYQDELADKQKDISKLENKLIAMQLDTSDKAKAERLKLEEEITEKKKDLSKYQADNALNNQLDALDKEYEAYEENLDSQIDAIRRYLDEEGTLRADAMKRIQSDGEKLYTQLLEYNRQYGTGVDEDISNAWSNAQSAMETYGDSQKNVLTTLQQMTAALDEFAAKVKSLESSSYSPQSYSLPQNKTGASLESIQNQMKANSQAWSATNDPAERQNLHDSNVRLAEQYSKMSGEELYYNSKDGSWYLGGKKIKLYHKGGIVGGGKPLLKSNEVFAKLLDDEIIVTPLQAENFIKNTMPRMLDLGSIKSPANKFENTFEFNFNGDVNKDTLPDLQKMLSNIPKIVTKELTSQLSARGIKTGALLKSF